MITMKATGLPKLQIVILAAGYSRRLGRSKALVRVHGMSLIRATLNRVKGLSARAPIVVVPPRASALRNELRAIAVRFVPNPQRSRGQSTSVRVGLARARYAPAVMLLPCDLVRLDRRDLKRLIARWHAAPRAIVSRRLGPQRGGAPLILPRRHFAAAATIRGDTGLRDFLLGIPTDQQRLVFLPCAAADVDTRQDLAQARRCYRTSPTRR